MKSRSDAPLLQSDEPRAGELINPEGSSAFILLCDHASNRVPRQLAQLGLSDEQLHSHIAWDAGAFAVAAALSQQLDAPLITAGYSRLVIDCNRAPHSNESIMELSDGVVIPGNQQLDNAAREQRQREIFAPYHALITKLLSTRSPLPTMMLSIHSFNPVLQGKHRPWEIGVCYGADRRLADRFLRGLAVHSHALIGDNQPFDIDPDIDYTLPQHADNNELPHVMLEIRRDCIENEARAKEWADTIARVCQQILNQAL